jgi:hypothetical protein
VGGSGRPVAGPDDPVAEPAALLGLGRPQLFQLLLVGACLPGEGIHHLKDVGEFFRGRYRRR